MTRFSELKRRWLQDPAVRAEYEGLEGEFALIRELIVARTRAGLTQAEVARRMGTTQSAVARLESGTAKPALATMERYAKATGSRLVVRLTPGRTTAKTAP